MWKTERKRRDPSSSIPGTNDVGKRRKLCIFFTQGSHFQTTYVALGCMTLPLFPVCTGFRGGVASSSWQIWVLQSKALKKFHFTPGWSGVHEAKEGAQPFLNMWTSCYCYKYCFWKLISQVLWLWGNTPQTSNNWSVFLWDFTPENVREKSWLALFQWTNHQIEV